MISIDRLAFASIRFCVLFWLIVSGTSAAFTQTIDESENLQRLEDLADQVDESFAFVVDTFGARARGMGTAFVAVADDGSAIANNPAGIAQIRVSQLSFARPVDELETAREGFLAFVQPMSTRRSVGGGIHSTHFSDSDDAEQILNVAYAWQLQTDSRIYIGMGGKVFSKDGPISFDGIAVDFGILAQPIGRNLILGLAGQNFGPDVKIRYDPRRFDKSFASVLSSAPDEHEIPFNLKFGAAYRSQLHALPFQITGQVDKSFIDDFARISLGTEIRLPGVLTVRAGYTSESDAGSDLSLGIGIHYNMMRIGYTYIDRELHANQHEAYLIVDFLSRLPKPPI
ncbi:MAG: hypothetical protein O7E52_14620 [Candidatus Poribacteria bacterium]|nr:hypothetical protein [Candidatus Poribacteria bacterium]